MATELAAGYISLVPSARGFGRSIIREAQSAGSSAGDAAASHFGSRFVSGMGQVAKRAAQALTVGLGAAAFFGIRTAANFEQVQIAFEGILGSADAAKKLIGELRDFAAKTPFEFPNLVKSAQQLLAVGFASDEIVPTMTEIGNVAATLGVSTPEIEGVVRALGQMKGKGKVSAEELRQISEQFPGFSAIKGIAEELGLSVAEVADIMEGPGGLLSVGIDGEKGVRLILDAMEEFPGAAGAMERQSKTLNGVISTFKDTLSTIAIDFITPYLPALSAGVLEVSGIVQGLADTLKTALASEGFQQFKDAAEGFVSDGLEALSGWWERNSETVIAGVKAAFEDIGGFAFGAGRFIRDELMPPLETFSTWLFEDGPGAQLVIAGLAAAFGVWALNAALAAVATLATFAPLILGAVLVGALAWATGELVDKLDLLPKASTVFQWITDHVIVPFIEQVQAAIDTVKDLIALLEKLPGGGGPLAGTPLGPLLDLFEGFDDGGVVGGRRGSPRLILAHAGETVLPTHKTPLPALTGGGGDTYLQIYGNEGESLIDRGIRELKWLRQVQLEVQSR